MALTPYTEKVEDLSPTVQTFARMVQVLLEEAQAISYYEQRIEVETDSDAKDIYCHAQEEEFEHFAMSLECLLRRKPPWREVVRKVLFQEGDITRRCGGKEMDQAA